MSTSIRLAQKHYDQLMAHLHSADCKEAVAFGICGRAINGDDHRLLINEIVIIPFEDCKAREVDRVTWKSDRLPELLDKAASKEWGIVKFHSHPLGGHIFSKFDDQSDQSLFPQIYTWLDSDLPNVSVIVTPDGGMTGRVVSKTGSFEPLTSAWLIGDDIRLLTPEIEFTKPPQFAKRIAQTFGDKTFTVLKGLRVGVVGCSGTGGPIIEQLVRNGVGHLELVDPDNIDYGNLNRITNSKVTDAESKTAKVNMHKLAIEAIGLGTDVSAHHSDLFDFTVVKALSHCDVIFGCMDTVDGRHMLNKLATYYLIPLIDVGVKLIADGVGGISQVCCQVNYIQPGLSSLYSRNVYNLAQLEAASLYRTDPSEYKLRENEGYIDGVNIDKPAVVSVNTLASSLAMNDLLSRLHSFRRDGNQDSAVIRFSLTDMFVVTEPESKLEQCEMFRKYVGHGDRKLLLNAPEFSNMESKLDD